MKKISKKAINRTRLDIKLLIKYRIVKKAKTLKKKTRYNISISIYIFLLIDFNSCYSIIYIQKLFSIFKLLTFFYIYYSLKKIPYKIHDISVIIILFLNFAILLSYYIFIRCHITIINLLNHI